MLGVCRCICFILKFTFCSRIRGFAQCWPNVGHLINFICAEKEAIILTGMYREICSSGIAA